MLKDNGNEAFTSFVCILLREISFKASRTLRVLVSFSGVLCSKGLVLFVTGSLNAPFNRSLDCSGL